MKKLKKINIFSFAKFQAAMMALVGLVCGALYSFGGLIIDALVTMGWLSSESMPTPGLSYGTILAFGALIGMPLIAITFGFLFGLVEGMLFNLFARWLGRIDLDFEQKG